MEATIRYPALNLIVTNSALPSLLVENNMVKISYNLLKADALYGTLGETIASLLAYPPLDSRGVWSDLRKLASYYKMRTVQFSLNDLSKAFDILALKVRITPLYPLARKAEIVDGLLSKLYLSMESNLDEKARVTREYKTILDEVGGVSYNNGFYAIEEPEKLINKSIGNPPIPPSDITRAMAARLLKKVRSEVEGPELRITGYHALLNSTRINLKCGKPEEIVKEYLNCEGKVKCSQGHAISSSILCKCQDLKLVVKDYARMGGKWIILKIMAKPMIEYRVSPRARMISEYNAMQRLSQVEGVEIPFFHELCSTQIQKALSVREYLEGKILRETNHPDYWVKAGKALGAIHHFGITLGDANSGNFVLTKGNNVGVLDAEQSYDYTLKTGVWDIVTFISTSVFWKIEQSLIIRFLEAYMEKAPEPLNVLKEASKASTWIGILPTVPYVYIQSKRILDQLVRTVN
ncbi:MAG: hypothetical protein F7B60_01610 [Desulfurococcales archaeon]|nr:hypothetical protein [Desulfurococcales archaeon]